MQKVERSTIVVIGIRLHFRTATLKDGFAVPDNP
jgi:hypothetical protein